jgi:FtsZ-interacting cell division protein YlmF
MKKETCCRNNNEATVATLSNLLSPTVSIHVIVKYGSWTLMAEEEEEEEEEEEVVKEEEVKEEVKEEEKEEEEEDRRRRRRKRRRRRRRIDLVQLLLSELSTSCCVFDGFSPIVIDSTGPSCRGGNSP